MYVDEELIKPSYLVKVKQEDDKRDKNDKKLDRDRDYRSKDDKYRNDRYGDERVKKEGYSRRSRSKDYDRDRKG